METNIDSLAHPLRHIEKVLAAILKEYAAVIVRFQSYQFEPGEYGAEGDQYRDKKSLNLYVKRGDDLVCQSLRDFFIEAEKNSEDVTILSRMTLVTQSGIECEYHLPMVDFAIDPTFPNIQELFDREVSEKLESALIDIARHSGSELKDFVFYESGRSFHGYGKVMLSQQEWTKFMGALLLLNREGYGYEKVVDDRWIGHRLVKGDSALRLTKNNPKYLQVPSFIECPF